MRCSPRPQSERPTSSRSRRLSTSPRSLRGSAGEAPWLSFPPLGTTRPTPSTNASSTASRSLRARWGESAELIAPDDRERVLFEPTPQGMAAALKRALSKGERPRPARPAFDDASLLERWCGPGDAAASRPLESARSWTSSSCTARSREALRRCLTALAGQLPRAGRDRRSRGQLRASPPTTSPRPLIALATQLIEAAREAGLQAAEAAWVVFLDEEDVPERKLLETLVRAQAASGAPPSPAGCT